MKKEFWLAVLAAIGFVLAIYVVMNLIYGWMLS